MLTTESMVGVRNTAQNERYMSGIFDNEEKFDEQ
jgi:hypothetical protein